MAKRVKTKKGSIGKKALAAILAASMVLSSSAFSVLAGPNEDNGIMPIDTYNTNLTVQLNGVIVGEGEDADYQVDYTGSPWTPKVTLTGSSSATGGRTFTEGTDYTVAYEDNLHAGTAIVTITPTTSGALGSTIDEPIVREFTIKPLTLGNYPTRVFWNDFGGTKYNGKNQAPTINYVRVDGIPGTTQSVTFGAENFDVSIYEDTNKDEVLNGSEGNAAVTEYKNAGYYIAGIKVKDLAKDDLGVGGANIEGNAYPYIIGAAPFNVTVENNVFPYEPYDSTLNPEEVGSKKKAQEQIEKYLQHVVVKDADGNVLKQGTDYVLDYEKDSNNNNLPKNIDMGTYSLSIKKADNNKNYEGDPVTATYTIGTSTLQQAVDYQIASAKAEGAKGPFTGNTDLIFNSKGEIVATYTGANLAPKKETEIKAFLANLGNKAGVTVNTANCDINIDEAINVGSYKVTLTGKQNLSGTAVIPFTVEPAPIKSEMVTGGALGYVGNGKASSTADLTVTFGSKSLEAGKDFSYKVGEMGTATDKTSIVNKSSVVTGKKNNKYAKVTIEGLGNFTTVNEEKNQTTVDVNVQVYAGVDLDCDEVTAEIVPNTIQWDGTRQDPTKDQIVVKYNGQTLVGSLSSSATTETADYKISYPTNGNVNAGTGTVTIRGTLNGSDLAELTTANMAKGAAGFYGTRNIEFTITGTDIANSAYELGAVQNIEFGKDVADSIEEGIVKASALRLLNKSTGNQVASTRIIDVKHAVYYINGERQGSETNKADNASYDAAKKYMTDTAKVGNCPYTVKIEVPGMGQYSGSLSVTYNVVAPELKNIAIDAIPDQTYTGSPIEPLVTVKDTSGTSAVVLTRGTDYDVTYSDNTNAGVAAVTVTIKGAHSGKAVAPFIIKPADATVSLDEDQKAELESGVTVGDTMDLKLSASMADTTLTYAAESDDTSVVSVSGTTLSFLKEGSAKVTITPSSANLNLTPATIDVTVKVEGKVAPAKKLKASCTPSRLKNVKNSFTVTTNTVKGADKWVIRYSLKNLNKTTKGSAKATFKNTKKVVQQVVKVNKSGAKYYVQCRVIKNGKKSAWSKVKTVTSR